jgi:hypothetical protein
MRVRREEASCSSGEYSVTTQLAWSTVQSQYPRRVAIAERKASCRARPSNVGSASACATVPARSRVKTGRLADSVTKVARFCSRGHPSAGMADKLTQEMIEESMARAETESYRAAVAANLDHTNGDW